MNEYERVCDELKKVLHDTAFVVAFDKEKGEPITIIAGPDTKVIKEGLGSIPSEIITFLAKEFNKDQININTFNWLNVHGSPGCKIPTARGGWKVIC